LGCYPAIGIPRCCGWVLCFGYISDNTVFAFVFPSDPWAVPSEYAALARKELEWEGNAQSAILDTDPVRGGIVDVICSGLKQSSAKSVESKSSRSSAQCTLGHLLEYSTVLSTCDKTSDFPLLLERLTVGGCFLSDVNQYCFVICLPPVVRVHRLQNIHKPVGYGVQKRDQVNLGPFAGYPRPCPSSYLRIAGPIKNRTPCKGL
jgi:hypothetical protein